MRISDWSSDLCSSDLLVELAKQRDTALASTADAESARQAADRRLRELQDAAQSEREAMTSHVRAIEDRAHAEVDRARQASREIQTLLSDRNIVEAGKSVAVRVDLGGGANLKKKNKT